MLEDLNERLFTHFVGGMWRAPLGQNLRDVRTPDGHLLARLVEAGPADVARALALAVPPGLAAGGAMLHAGPGPHAPGVPARAAPVPPVGEAPAAGPALDPGAALSAPAPSADGPWTARAEADLRAFAAGSPAGLPVRAVPGGRGEELSEDALQALALRAAAGLAQGGDAIALARRLEGLDPAPGAVDARALAAAARPVARMLGGRPPGAVVVLPCARLAPGLLLGQLLGGLASGRPVVLKPAPSGAISPLPLIDLLRGPGFEGRAISLLQGGGAATGALLLAHPGVAAALAPGKPAPRAALAAAAAARPGLLLPGADDGP